MNAGERASLEKRARAVLSTMNHLLEVGINLALSSGVPTKVVAGMLRQTASSLEKVEEKPGTYPKLRLETWHAGDPLPNIEAETIFLGDFGSSDVREVRQEDLEAERNKKRH